MIKNTLKVGMLLVLFTTSMQSDEGWRSYISFIPQVLKNDRTMKWITTFSAAFCGYTAYQNFINMKKCEKHLKLRDTPYGQFELENFIFQNQLRCAGWSLAAVASLTGAVKYWSK